MVQENSVHAIYSPTIANQVSKIKSHVLEAREVNGNGSITSAISFLKDRDAESKLKNNATGLPAKAIQAQQTNLEDLLLTLTLRPLGSILMIFNINMIRPPEPPEIISNCLRDDIWKLEDMKESVFQEMLKSYLLGDTHNGDILSDDFNYLRQHLNILREKGGHSKAKITLLDGTEVSTQQYLFGENSDTNYYEFKFLEGGCPDGEFQSVFKEVKNAIKTLGVIGSGSGSDWGDIWEMAKANSKRKAQKWIKENQISLTIGGKNGANQDSLVKGGGWDKFTGQFKTQLGILIDNVIGPVTPIFNIKLFQPTNISIGESGCVIFYPKENVFRACTNEQKDIFNQCNKLNKQSDSWDELNCNRFKNAKEKITAVNRIKKQKAEIQEHTRRIQEAETAFVYNVQLNSVGENNLKNIEEILWEINKTIAQGYEGVSQEAGKELPTINSNLQTFINNHCPNKQ